MSRKILIVLTSNDRLGDTGNKTGFWLEEMAAPYYVFKDAGLVVTLASPKGGAAPIDPGSDTEESQTEATRRFKADENALAELANTVPLNQIKASDYDAVFYAGGYGPLWDLVNDQNSINLIEQLWAADKPVAAVCHGPCALVNARDPQGEYILKGRQANGFTNDEEEGTDLKPVCRCSSKMCSLTAAPGL